MSSPCSGFLGDQGQLLQLARQGAGQEAVDFHRVVRQAVQGQFAQVWQPPRREQGLQGGGRQVFHHQFRQPIQFAGGQQRLPRRPDVSPRSTAIFRSRSGAGFAARASSPADRILLGRGGGRSTGERAGRPAGPGRRPPRRCGKAARGEVSAAPRAPEGFHPASAPRTRADVQRAEVAQVRAPGQARKEASPRERLSPRDSQVRFFAWAEPASAATSASELSFISYFRVLSPAKEGDSTRSFKQPAGSRLQVRMSLRSRPISSERAGPARRAGPGTSWSD